MRLDLRRTGRKAGKLSAAMAAVVFLAACGTPEPKLGLAGSTSTTKEYFSEAEYGVKASPRVSDKRSRLPRGGGRYQVGKPYQIKGRWYRPQEDPDYKAVGAASWYGDAFHGRLTANGEIYDMTHLTAAHPTLPLPSYARVTNLKNGNSVVVRINDRGPFARGRIIDLSRRAAELLDYTHAGVAKVEVEYLGKAPLHGRDDEFLLASYRPGGDDAAPGVMVAMNGPTPSAPVGAAERAFSSLPGVGDPAALPVLGPLLSERPERDTADGRRPRLPVLSYADQRVREASGSPFDRLLRVRADMDAADIAQSWKRQGFERATRGR